MCEGFLTGGCVYTWACECVYLCAFVCKRVTFVIESNKIQSNKSDINLERGARAGSIKGVVSISSEAAVTILLPENACYYLLLALLLNPSS